MTIQQNDPTELLEVFDAAGRPTGMARSRAEIHTKGDWHLAFHCWILRRGGSEVVLQRRSLQKDTFAGRWDAAAAGHWRSGESAEEAAREIDEELGIAVRFEDLVYRGRERAARRFPNGLIDREFHEVYVLEDDRPLTDYRPDPAEVSALAAFPLRQLLKATAHRVEQTIASTEAVDVKTDRRLEPTKLVVSTDELVPYSRARLRRNLVARNRVDTIRKLWRKATRTRRLLSAPE